MTRCSYASCTARATAHEDGWDFCAPHLASHRADKPGAAPVEQIEASLRSTPAGPPPLPDGAYVPDQPLLEPEEVAFVLALRERLRKVDRLYQASEAERVQWEATHPEDEPYIALDHKGADAYSECVEALADTALDAFNLVARALGVSGWQASVAEMQFFARSRRIKGPWGVYTMEDALYPQYDLVDRLQQMRWSDETVTWLGDCAEYALAVRDDGIVAPRVADHWRWLVAQRDERATSPSAPSEAQP